MICMTWLQHLFQPPLAASLSSIYSLWHRVARYWGTRFRLRDDNRVGRVVACRTNATRASMFPGATTLKLRLLDL